MLVENQSISSEVFTTSISASSSYSFAKNHSWLLRTKRIGQNVCVVEYGARSGAY